MPNGINQHDTLILRDLAKRRLAIAKDPVTLERAQLWREHNSLRRTRPMILSETGGVMGELLTDAELTCLGTEARSIEKGLRLDLFRAEQVDDDYILTDTWRIGWRISNTGYGVKSIVHHADNDGNLGARSWEPPLKNLNEDFEKLNPRQFTVDRAATYDYRARMQELFDGILKVEIRGGYNTWTMGMTGTAIDLIGLENLMLAMYDDPEGLHRLMAFLRDDTINFVKWQEKEGLLTLNNQDDYIGSGGMGYTGDLPQRDWKYGDSVRLKDLWVLSESQETVGVGPDLFAEFIFPYQKDVVKLFGLTYYGCCEPVHSRWHVLRQLDNLRTLSVSPWCDQQKMAEWLGDKYIFARKPNPTLISTDRFDEDQIRADIRETLDIAAGCHLELAMKDVHTIKNQRWRLGRWVQLVREEIDRVF